MSSTGSSTGSTPKLATQSSDTDHEHVHGPDCEHDHHHHHEAQLPYRREEPKLGRNDPCHCGSGKKFKKCHGA